MSTDDFLFKYGKVRFHNGKLQVDLVIGCNTKGMKKLKKVEKLLEKAGLRGSTITVGY